MVGSCRQVSPPWIRWELKHRLALARAASGRGDVASLLVMGLYLQLLRLRAAGRWNYTNYTALGDDRPPFAIHSSAL